ncbi:coatomer subunit delta [Didymella sp. IMI 355093]|nr:coatomer subunit delta [Didymella sp. IMI 355093]
MVVLAASICTRGGKAVLSRQFREMQRSRIEALLASFPKLADSNTQHTTCEQDNVRYVYQPLDELYMVLITNLQSNILQDINSLHLFAQVVSSTCKSLDEREILRNAFELLTAFDEIVTLGYRENLTMSQIKTFLDMESHEERIQEIIARNKELEASEERKRRAKQLEMQRKEMSRSQRAGGGMGGGMGSGMGSGMGGGMGRQSSYPAFTPSAPTQTVPDTYDSYEASKKAPAKPLALGKKGMQLGKKNKTNSAFDQIAGDLPPESEPLVAPKASAPAQAAPASARQSTSTDREAIHITTNETISARLDREGLLKSFEVKGEMQLKISDASLTQVKLDLHTGDTRGAQLMTHPKVDKAVFRNSQVIQLADTTKGFPSNMGIGVMKWKLAPRPDDVSDPPITFRVWVEESGSTFNITVEYELTGSDPLKDVTVTIPYETDEPNVGSFDAVYEVSGDSIEWNIGAVDESNSSGSFEFEAQAGTDAEFFPMRVRFSKSTPFVDVDVSNVTLLSMNQDIGFTKDVRSTADVYEIA